MTDTACTAEGCLCPQYVPANNEKIGERCINSFTIFCKKRREEHNADIWHDFDGPGELCEMPVIVQECPHDEETHKKK